MKSFLARLGMDFGMSFVVFFVSMLSFIKEDGWLGHALVVAAVGFVGTAIMLEVANFKIKRLFDESVLALLFVSYWVPFALTFATTAIVLEALPNSLLYATPIVSVVIAVIITAGFWIFWKSFLGGVGTFLQDPERYLPTFFKWIVAPNLLFGVLLFIGVDIDTTMAIVLIVLVFSIRINGRNLKSYYQ